MMGTTSSSIAKAIVACGILLLFTTIFGLVLTWFPGRRAFTAYVVLEIIWLIYQIG